MAESIIIHFSSTKIDEVSSVFNGCAECIGDTMYALSENSYCVKIYEYEDYRLEYEDIDKIEIEDALGSAPNFSYCIELRRSVQNKACDLAKKIITNTLLPFDYVVDDCIHKIWLKNEIVAHIDKFLESYYYS